MSAINLEGNEFVSPTSPKAATRGKTDPAWGHCVERIVVVKNKNVKVIACLHCEKTFQGGGINRFKKHLAGVRGDVVPCKKVPQEVSFQMQQSIDEFSNKKRRLNELDERSHSDEDQSPIDLTNEEEGNMSAPSSSKGRHVALSGGQLAASQKRSEVVKRNAKLGAGHCFMPRTTPGAQPSMKSVLQSKEVKEKVDLSVSKWMVDAGVPFNASNSKYYQPMLDAIASFGPGYRGPNFHDLRGYLLEKNTEEVKKFVEGFRSVWKETGCTIMADGWTDQRRRTLINFLVQCPKGTVFLKSIDATEESKTAEMLFKLFKEVVQFVGSENVVHIVTDNARNYVAAGRLLEGEFPSLYWSPCAAHCINLMLSDMGKLVEVGAVVDKASSMTKYIYNHCYPLHLMRQFTKGREILRPAPTRFATNFIALQSIYTQKDALRAMVACREWTISSYAKEKKGKKFKEDVLDQQFWKNCATICQITEPLVRVLRIVDSDERPAMGFLYGAIHAAKEEIGWRFQRKKKVAQPFLEIIEARWDEQLSKDLHAAGYWFNPSNQYNSTEFAKHRKTISGVHDVIERFAHGQVGLQTKLTGEMKLFRNAEGDFGRTTTIRNRSQMPPDEWWITFGSSAPNLQKLAVRILGQTCSSSGCERNWSVFEFIHSKKRNRMEHQRLNDLVYVRYNLRLHQRYEKYYSPFHDLVEKFNFVMTDMKLRFWISSRGRNYDPINFEDFNDNGNWVLEDDPPFLTVDEIEEFRKQMAGLKIQTNEDNDEVLNLDEFDFDDEIEDPCTDNTGVQEQGNQSVEARETIEEEPGYATPNNDMYQDISVTAWHFS
ncbi:uncharacterized protein LOC144545498 [Carex rostrata]